MKVLDIVELLVFSNSLVCRVIVMFLVSWWVWYWMLVVLVKVVLRLLMCVVRWVLLWLLFSLVNNVLSFFGFFDRVCSMFRYCMLLEFFQIEFIGVLWYSCGRMVFLMQLVLFMYLEVLLIIVGVCLQIQYLFIVVIRWVNFFFCLLWVWFRVCFMCRVRVSVVLFFRVRLVSMFCISGCLVSICLLILWQVQWWVVWVNV